MDRASTPGIGTAASQSDRAQFVRRSDDAAGASFERALDELVMRQLVDVLVPKSAAGFGGKSPGADAWRSLMVDTIAAATAQALRIQPRRG
jgi:hypothetical protein